MGLLNKFLGPNSKKDLMKAMEKVSDFVAESAKEVEKVVDTAKAVEIKKRQTVSRAPSPKSYNTNYQTSYRSRTELLAYMKEMIERNFPDYQVLYKLDAWHLQPDCHPACTPVEFMFTQNGQYVLAVVIVRKNTYRGMNVIGTRKICEDLGIPYIRFFEEYPNEESYVVPRIQKYL